jgi:Holliday junction DNA helicase RuvB
VTLDEDVLWTAEEPVEEFERAYRPVALDDFVGQPHVRRNLGVAVGAARLRSEPLDHVLFVGPPGLGKTTLAGILATEMGVPFEKTSGPVLERPKDLAAILARLAPGAVLFIDEIHRLGSAVEEVLYPALEDFEIDLLVGEGPAARSVKLRLSPFTLVGATTRASLLSRPLLDRFGMTEELDYYDLDDLAAVVARYAAKLDVALEPGGAAVIARRSRGTPRVALAHLRRVRDYAMVRSEAMVTAATAEAALDALGVDVRGLARPHRRYLDALVGHYRGGPTGVGTLAAALGEDARTLEEVVEPLLIRLGLIDRTPRGRVATARGHEHVGAAAGIRQGGLFDHGKSAAS